MGSILASSARGLICSKRQLGRTKVVPHLSPRSTPYALDTAQLSFTSTSSYERYGVCDSATSAIGFAGLSTRGQVWSYKSTMSGSTPAFRIKGRKQCSPLAASFSRLFSGLLAARGGIRRKSRVLPLPQKRSPLPALSATAAGADTEDTLACYTSGDGLTVSIRKVRTLDELRQVATLRADAYHAENHSRFVQSLKRKFVEQEVESLQMRTTYVSQQGKPYTECLVAVGASGAVLSCIDMRLPAALNGTHPHGVPEDDSHGCYLLNVVVREDVRGQGLGRAIMQAAMARAVHVWGARQLYTHVEADNEVAHRLYSSCGFAQHSVETKVQSAASKLGRTLLLRAPASAAPPSIAA